MIKASGLTKYFGNVCAIEDVSFEVEKGELLGFLGPNAAGKTTTMRILTGYFPPTKGTAQVAGFDILENSLEARRRIGYVPENFPLYKDMDVTSYLDFVAAVKGVDHRERRSHVNSIIDRCGLQEVRKSLIGRLSKGYCQRAGIAQALIKSPDVLVLDEPTTGLDPKQIIEIRNLIKSLAGKATVLLSTHILPEVSMTCQRVIIINQGKIIAMDTPENLTVRLRKSDRILVEVEGPKKKAITVLRDVRGVLDVDSPQEISPGIHTITLDLDRETGSRKAIAQAIVNSGLGLLELRPLDLTLEDIFIRLITEEGQEQ